MQFVFVIWIYVCYVYSGEIYYFSSIKFEKIVFFVNIVCVVGELCIIFIIYYFLYCVVESGIDIDIIYYDEVYNVIGKYFFKSVFVVFEYVKCCYYFIVILCIGCGVSVVCGMNNSDVYGGIFCNVFVCELIDVGVIVFFKVVFFEMNCICIKYNVYEVDVDNLCDMFE